MKPEEYYKKELETFEAANIPEEFRSAISSYAYERGHSAGYSECFIYLTDLIEDLKDPIRKFAERLTK